MNFDPTDRLYAAELANDESREIPSYLTDAQYEQIADEIRARADMSEAAERAAAQDRADLVALRNYTQVLELQYADALDQLTQMTALRDGLVNIMARAYGNRWGNPGEHGVQRLHADTMPHSRAA